MDSVVKVLVLWTIVLISYQHSACFVEAAFIGKPHSNRSSLTTSPSSEYKSETVRRQQVIHPLDDESSSTDTPSSSSTTSKSKVANVAADDDDDIEKFGKAIDSTGTVINEPLSSSSLKHEKDSAITSNNKAIIARIKEIQDKIFKRTSLSNNKELEDRLRLMSPGSLGSSSVSSSLPAQKSIEPVTMLKPKQPVDVQGDRRKIIPEDVVDKILEKFQQLRSDAKHIALASSDDSAKKADKVSVKEIPADLTDGSASNKTPPNPYASIGPPKESSEIANRTGNTEEVTSFGMTGASSGGGVGGESQTRNIPQSQSPQVSSNGEIQIPIGNAANAPDSNSNKNFPITTLPSADGKSPNGAGIPIMFIKNGPNLIPVYKNGGAPTNTDNISPPAAASQQIPMMSQQQQQQQQQIPSFSQPSNDQNSVIPMMEPWNDNKNEENPSTADSRCDIPGAPCADNVEQHFEPDRMTSDMKKTGELIDRLIHTPGFPQLASKLISEGKVNYDDSSNGGGGGGGDMLGPDTGDSRNVVPLNGNTVDRLDHAQVNFDMKGNYATSNFPTSSSSDPSMLREEEERHRDEERRRKDIEKFLEHQPRSKSDVSNYEDDFHNAKGGRSPSGLDGRFVNDISDPADRDIQSKFESKSADELLDYAKYRSLTAPDLHAPPGSQFGSPPPENSFEPSASLQRSLPNNEEENPGDRDSIERRYMNEDPSTLLDDLHKSQMQLGLSGPGESLNRDSTATKMMDEEEQGDGRHHIPEPEPAPDDLLEQVRSFNHKMVARQLQHRQRIEQEKKNLNRGGGGFGNMDPSFADEIRSDGGLVQRFDVQRKDLATENDVQLLKGRTSPSSRTAPRNFGQMSAMSGDAVQFNNGRLSMDTDNVVSSFNEEGEYSRNTIGRPRHRHRKHKRHHKNKQQQQFVHPYTRGIIEHPVAVDSDIELRVNGQTLTDNTQLRSTIVDGKVKPGKGKTFTSKEPVQIELSHGDDKRKIINIVTKGKYRVVNDKKRFHIPH